MSAPLRLLAWACLAAAGCLFTTGASADTVTVELVTGSDDLRGGGDNVNVRLLDVDGETIADRMNANNSAGWANGSTHSVMLSIDSADLDRLAAVELETTFGGGIGGDNWNLDAVRVLRSGRVLFETHGAPLFRFTGDRRSRSFPFAVQQCRTDHDCDDGVSANGAEVCASLARADGVTVRQCQAGTRPACPAGQSWREDTDRCVTNLLDADGDGSSSDEDCNDNDALSHPGAPEICDALGRDEDCDLRTAGTRDADGDGHVSSECFNWGPEAGG